MEQKTVIAQLHFVEVIVTATRTTKASRKLFRFYWQNHSAGNDVGWTNYDGTSCEDFIN